MKLFQLYVSKHKQTKSNRRPHFFIKACIIIHNIMLIFLVKRYRHIYVAFGFQNTFPTVLPVTLNPQSSCKALPVTTTRTLLWGAVQLTATNIASTSVSLNLLANRESKWGFIRWLTVIGLVWVEGWFVINIKVISRRSFHITSVPNHQPCDSAYDRLLPTNH